MVRNLRVPPALRLPPTAIGSGVAWRVENRSSSWTLAAVGYSVKPAPAAAVLADVDRWRQSARAATCRDVRAPPATTDRTSAGFLFRVCGLDPEPLECLLDSVRVPSARGVEQQQARDGHVEGDQIRDLGAEFCGEQGQHRNRGDAFPGFDLGQVALVEIAVGSELFLRNARLLPELADPRAEAAGKYGGAGAAGHPSTLRRCVPGLVGTEPESRYRLRQ